MKEPGHPRHTQRAVVQVEDAAGHADVAHRPTHFHEAAAYIRQ